MTIRRALIFICGLVAILSLAASTVFFQMVRDRPFWRGQFGVDWLAMVVCVVAVSVWLGYSIAQMFRKRLYMIEEAVTLVASGRLQYRIAVELQGDADELSNLARQFNRMSEKIENQVNLLQRLAEENRLLAADAERAATMDERQRLSRELHDSVSQELFALTMLAETAHRLYIAKSPKLEKTIVQMTELANRAQREMRALLLHLRPVELDGHALAEAIPTFLQAVQERHRLQCIFEYHIEKRLPNTVEEHLFRIVQEAIANVLKHADASMVRIQLSAHTSTYQLVIADDGVGITNQAVGKLKDSYGIKAMNERATLLGGRLEVWPRNPGTTIEVNIPRVVAKGEEV